MNYVNFHVMCERNITILQPNIGTGQGLIPSGSKVTEETAKLRKLYSDLNL
jgi:hypothetical protein